MTAPDNRPSYVGLSQARSSGLPIGARVTENGDVIQGVVQAASYNTHAEASAAVEAMRESPERDAARAKLAEIENRTCGRIMGGALERAALIDNEVIEADRVTGQQLSTARDLIERLNKGTMSAADAAAVFDNIVRAQTGLNRRVESWRESTARAADHYRDPLKAHDDLVRRLPALRAGRPLVSF